MMEMQKRQRLETIQRFQKHLDKVNSIVKVAFSSLPEKDDDNKLFLPKIAEQKKIKGNNLEQLDHIMCDIVDNQGI
jgi:mediator of RNA polymerase II transcription subunit 7